MSRIPPHAARIVSAWPQGESRPRRRSPLVGNAWHAVAGRLVGLARLVHLVRSPAPPTVTGRLGHHA